ncbi:MAG: preprotein translocase subunit YajC [Clostridia bacterium]|nr:preprotein translocase subunit YajC [Clostridia bacterium]
MFNFLLTSNSSGGGSFMPIILLVLMFVVMYFLMIRPQKKQEQEAQKMRDNLAVGDEVTTIGGIIGEIVSIKDETVTIETSRAGTKIRFLKSAIRNVDVSAEDKKKAAEGENK